MNIMRIEPPPRPATFTMSFTKSEGWAIVAALRYYADTHPQAAEKDTWKRWSKDLDHELRL